MANDADTIRQSLESAGLDIGDGTGNDVVTDDANDNDPGEGVIDDDTTTVVNDDSDNVVDGEDGQEEVPVVAGGVDTRTPAEKAADEKLTKELEELGIRAPKPGQRENRLPYSRMKKIYSNAQQKWVAAHQGELSSIQKELNNHKQRVAEFEHVDKLAGTNSDAYIQILASLHPELYGKYLKPENVRQPSKPAANTERPGADVKFPDGTTGYSAEQFQKVLDWEREQVRSQVTTELTKTFEDRFGPIEKDYRTNQEYAKRAPVVQARIRAIESQWGEKLVKDNEAAIIVAMQQGMTPEAAATSVLLPLVRTDQAKVRQQVLDELNSRKKAARATPAAGGAGTVTAKPTTSSDKGTDIIRQSLIDQGLLQG